MSQCRKCSLQPNWGKLLVEPLLRKLRAFLSNSIIWWSYYFYNYIPFWQIFNLTPDQVSTCISCINYKKTNKKNDITILTARVWDLFGRVCEFINGGKSYLMLTWCCALNLIMIITVITNTDNIFQSDTATLMNQSKTEYISVHFHQRLRGSSFWEIYQRAFWLCSHCIQFKLVFQTILQVMKSDFFI